jgi:type II secretory pathway component PulF
MKQSMPYALCLVLFAATCVWVIAPAFLARRRHELRLQMLELLATAVRRGLPLPPLVERLAIGTRGASRRLLVQLAARLQGGEALAAALAGTAPWAFPDHVIRQIAAAQGSEHLADTLTALAHDTGRGLTAQHKITLALLYPAMLALGLVLFRWRVGRWLDWMRLDMHRPGSAWTGTLPWLALALTTAAIMCSLLLQRRGWRWPWLGRLSTALATWLPGVAGLRRLITSERLLQTLAAHLAGGRSFADALELAGCNSAAGAVREGMGAEQAWRRTDLPPSVAARACLVSGKSGRDLARSLEALAAECGQRTELRLARMIRWLQPLALLLFGALLAIEFRDIFVWYAAKRQELALW